MQSNGVRMADIANKLGISIVTVSKALADKKGVSEELRNKIKETALEMGYYKKEYNSGQADSYVGIIIEEGYLKPQHSFFWALYMNVVDALKEHSYYSILEVIKLDIDRKAPDFLVQKSVDGLIIIGAIEEEYLKYLSTFNVPLTLIDFYCDSVNAVSVITDSFLGAYDLTELLIKKGHRNIGFIGSIDSNMNSEDRYYGYLKALSKNGLKHDEDWIHPDKLGLDFIEEYKLPKEVPTAFVCSSDQSAYHFVRYLLSIGYKVPQNISVTGFYDYIFATLVSPSITTYRIDMKYFALQAVTAHLNQINTTKFLPKRIIVSGDIIERESVCSYNGLSAGGC